MKRMKNPFGADNITRSEKKRRAEEKDRLEQIAIALAMIKDVVPTLPYGVALVAFADAVVNHPQATAAATMVTANTLARHADNLDRAERERT